MQQNSKSQADANGGPQTPEGKAITRYNAQKHAILRDSISRHEKFEYEQIFNDLAEDVKPEGYLQEKLVEIMAVNFIRLHRISKAESEQIKEAVSSLVPIPAEVSSGFDRYNIGFEDDNEKEKSYSAVVAGNAVQRLELFSRYQTATENRIYRAIMMLRQLKTYGQ